MTGRALPVDSAVLWLPAVLLPPVFVFGAAISDQTITAGLVLAAIVGCLPLLLRRRLAYPLLLPLFLAGTGVVVVFVQPGQTVVLLPMVMLYDLARQGTRQRSYWLAVITVPSVLLSTIPFQHGKALAEAIAVSLILCGLAILAGDLLRSRQVATERSAEAREAHMLQRLADERLAIAHEIHDTVAHAMTAINVQAGVAAHLIDRDPAQAHAALRAIKDTSGAALADLRSTLHVLRGPAGAPELSPTADLSDLDELLDGLRRAGLEVELTADATANLPGPVQAAGYRIIQEATTNVLRHADATRVCIELRHEPGGFRIQVRDDGSGATKSNPSPGNGLAGMRERAAALGGELTAAPTHPQGWQVTARLPVTPSPA